MKHNPDCHCVYCNTLGVNMSEGKPVLGHVEPPSEKLEVVEAPREVKLRNKCPYCGTNPCTSQYVGCGETQAVERERNRIISIAKEMMKESYKDWDGRNLIEVPEHARIYNQGLTNLIERIEKEGDN